MRIAVFLSHPTPYNTKQKEFIEKLKNILKDRGLEPRTLGVTDYNCSVNNDKKVNVKIKWSFMCSIKKVLY